MASPYSTIKQQVLAKSQSVEGTMETLSATDGKTRLVYGNVPNYEAPKIERNIARQSLTPYGMLSTTKALAFALKAEVNTPDTITNPLEFAALLQACGMVGQQYQRIAIGAITGGPVARNATATGATSGGTGRVLVPATTGDAFLLYLPSTGTLQNGETLNFTGGASCVTSGAPSGYGRLIAPVSTPSVISLEFQEDGYAWSARDAAGNMTIEAEDSKPGYFNFAIQGVKNAMGAKAMTSGIAFDVQDPPVMQNAQLKIGSWLPIFSKWSFDLGNNVVPRQNGNALGNTGLQGFAVRGQRKPKFKLTMEFVDDSVFDFFTNHDSSTKNAIQARIGTVAGRTTWFFMDQAEVDPTSFSDSGNIRQIDAEFFCSSLVDNREIEIVTA